MNRQKHQRQRRPLKVKVQTFQWQQPLLGALLVLVLLIIARTTGGA